MKIFIDTNIFLTFYHFSSDDLEELRKLGAILGDPKTTLYISDQVKDELKRNRENKIADALKRFQSQKMEDQFPQMCKEYPEYQEMRQAGKSFYENKEKIQEKLIADISGNTLKADLIIEELISKAELLSSDIEVRELAKRRMELRSPPGKKGSLGDAINWETLLAKVPTGNDIYFISGDEDYVSPLSEALNENVFNKYLSEEWQAKKKAGVFFYQRLSEFLNEKFPAIKFASELEKEISIRNFVDSGSFQATHSAVRKLSKTEHFTPSEVNQIIDAAVSNGQISSIVGDNDVKGFIDRLFKDYSDIMDSAIRGRLGELMQETEDLPVDDGNPF